ncbi:MAG: N-acetylmuramoyl-L-alanine amidase [Rhizobiaceae bacterium]|nr:N-acetylmuramoyl-L-alanine amidase [Rhizobiaceae bacterium]
MRQDLSKATSWVAHIFGVLAIATFAFVGAAFAGLKASSVQLSGDSQKTEVRISIDQDPDLHWFLLRTPYRLVVELPETTFAIEPRSLKPLGLVDGVRYGKAAEGRSRIIFTSRKPFSVERVEIESGADKDGYSLAVSLAASSDSAFQSAMSEQVSATASIPARPDGDTTPVKPFTVVIDPGHGGFDGGAEGVSGTREKDITLAFSRELRDSLIQLPNFKVVMTRDSDMFLRLDDRVRVAQSNEADLFISIHADSIRYTGLRGATVYTGSDQASDADSQALADRENLVDQIGSASLPEENQEVTDILFDFVRRETQDYSWRVAKDLVGSLSQTIGVINNPHRHARFRVLRAPDVPSVLVELGYLSNADDESSLLDPQWRAKAVGSIATAVEKFAERKGVSTAQTER